jgi:hypothetical protein
MRRCTSFSDEHFTGTARRCNLGLDEELFSGRMARTSLPIRAVMSSGTFCAEKPPAINPSFDDGTAGPSRTASEPRRKSSLASRGTRCWRTAAGAWSRQN